MGRKRFGGDFQLLFRLLKAGLFIVAVSVLSGLFLVFEFTSSDLYTCLLAFLPTGWGILLVTNCDKHLMENQNDNSPVFENPQNIPRFSKLTLLHRG